MRAAASRGHAMRASIDRTNDGLSWMPADGISLPPKKDFGTSRWGGSKVRLHQRRHRTEGDHDRLWHEAADPECPLHGRFRGVSSIGQCNTSCSLLAGVSKAKVFRGR